MARVSFADGTPFTSKHFTIQDEFRRIRSDDRQGIVLAAGMLEGAPARSIILARRESIVARAFGYGSMKAACDSLEAQLDGYQERNSRFKKNMAAVLNFAPNWSEALSIAGTGADILYAPLRQGPDPDGIDDAMIDFWLGHAREQFREGDKNGYQERALIRPRHSRFNQKRGPQ